MSIWWRSNQAIGLYLLLMFGALFAYIWMQPWAHRVMRDGFLLGMMPMLGIGLMSICALAMVFDPMRREQPEGLQGIRASDAWLPIVMLVGVAVCFWAMSWLGFILAASPFYWCSCCGLDFGLFAWHSFWLWLCPSLCLPFLPCWVFVYRAVL